MQKKSIVNRQMPQYVGDCWENLCRQYVGGNMIDGVVYNMARWWGKIFPADKKDEEIVELDVVAESFP